MRVKTLGKMLMRKRTGGKRGNGKCIWQTKTGSQRQDSTIDPNKKAVTPMEQ